MKFRSLVLGLSVLSLCSCHQNQSGNNISNEVVAEVDGVAIKSIELTQAISQQLFDELNRIYGMKDVALDYLIDRKIIEQEAQKHGMTASEYLEKYYIQKILESGVDSLLSFYGITSIPAIKGTSMVNMNNTSHEGRIMQETALKLKLKQELLDSLKADVEIHKYIYPPVSSRFNLEDLPIYYRGSLKSKVTMVVVSDAECDKCVQFHDRYNEIYEKYKDRVRFGSIGFSGSVTLSSLALDAADKQNKYWEFSDSLYTKNGLVDSVSVYSVARTLNLDMEKFDRDLHSKSALELLQNVNDELVKKGLFATPTIIINGRLIFDSGSTKEIAHLLEKELAE